MLRIRLFAATAVLLPVIAGSAWAADPSADKLFGKFIGSTPRGPELVKALAVPPRKDVECTFSLECFEGDAHAPTTYRLTCDHGAYSYQKPKTQQQREAITKEGKWKLGKSSKWPNLRTLELEGGLKLLEVSKSVLHFIGDEDQLLVGDGGYSYTLHRAEAAEKPGDWHLANVKPDDAPYKIAPVSTGANVYGVFEGRTPYIGIAKQLKHSWDESYIKAKWRITLYQDEKTKAPAEYKIEGTFFKPEPRTGKWKLEKGKEGAWSKVILEATKTQPQLVLLMGDANVLFIADELGQPRVGHSEFGYTMNRKAEAQKPTESRSCP